MIKISDKVVKEQKNFWNNCLFHPTDAVEDPWGKRILDRMASDGSIETVRIYAMFEDIAYLDENDNVVYDFRLSDLRLDYLIEKGYNLLIAYGMMPDFLATNKFSTSNVSHKKTRYKGKLLNTSKPKDYKIWEEICYEYTKHIVQRYGEDTVAKWHLHCMNEPDIPDFFLSEVPPSEVDVRVEEYCKLYSGFANGILRVSDKLCFGGPALAGNLQFLEKFLKYIKESGTRLDYIALHNYASTGPGQLNTEMKKICVSNWLETMQNYIDTIEKCGFSDTELVLDEWGMVAAGFFNMEDCPSFVARETEVFSSYYVRMIAKILEKGWDISKLMICLSGQHEMETDFTGFRNFFTLNFIAKPIYNAHVLASKLKRGLVAVEKDNENLSIIPTKDDGGNYAVLMTYCADDFDDEIPEITEEISFDEEFEGKTVTVWCIDRNTTNPYRLSRTLCIRKLGPAEIPVFRKNGTLKPVIQADAKEKISLKFLPNSVYLIEIS